MTLIALFCYLFQIHLKLSSWPGLKPHLNIENWKCGKMRVLYNTSNMVIGRDFFSLFLKRR